MDRLAARVIQSVPEAAHPLLVEREDVKKVLLIGIASDRGLCGGFNMNIGLHIENFAAENKGKYDRIGAYLYGRKVRDYLVRRKVDIVKSWVDIKKVDQSVVDAIGSEVIQLYLDGEFDKVYLVYTHFESAIKQTVRFEEFLPIGGPGATEPIDYIWEPDKKQILDALIPKYISTKIYYALVESQTSEHAARMSAMENATNNCGEMTRYLTLVYNKRRQESITNEMMDIVGGAEALRGT
jgi:F-type H+-transporting ATPase subunit gamma